MPSNLLLRHCQPVPAGTPASTSAEIKAWLSEIPGWEMVDGRLRREFKFPDFASALRFVNRIGEIAEAEQHHPDVQLSWGRVVVETYTHSVGGMSVNDFTLAAKIDNLPRK